MKYEVHLNNEKIYQSDNITSCVDKCLEHIQYDFKSFNNSNYVLIYEPERCKFVWNSRLSDIFKV
jgi:hypothetical protein